MPRRRRGCGHGRGPGRGRGRGRADSTEACDKDDSKMTKIQDIAGFTALLKTKGRIQCPNAGCSKSFVTIYGIEYHLKRCGVNPDDVKKYYCSLCPDKVYISERGLIMHQRTIHEEKPQREEKPEENLEEHGQRKAARRAMEQVKRLRDAISDPSDYATRKGALKSKIRPDDYIPEDGNSDIDDDDEEEYEEDDDEEYEEDDDSSVGRKPVQTLDVKTFQKMTYASHCERLCSMQDVLFPDLRSKLSTWPEISERSDDTSYDQVLKIRGSHLRTEDSRVESMTSLPLYSATEIQSKEDGNIPHFAFNVGGVVRSVAWCPVPISEDCTDQYAAFSPYYSNDQVHEASTSPTDSSFIQIWGFGPLQNHSCNPALKFIIMHNAGNIHSLKWCPSGCWEKPCLLESSKQQWDKRLGLLAAACSDGSVLVYSIPHPTKDQASCLQLPKVYKPVPSLVLRSGRESKTKGNSLGPCLCLDWQQRKPHSKLAAGYSCGSIAIWNVEIQSTLIRKSNTNGSITVLPIQVFMAHSGPVLTISWSPVDNDMMCSIGRKRMLHFWDIHQPSLPVCSHFYPNAPQTCQWLSHYSGVLTVEDGHSQRVVLQDVSSIITQPLIIYSQQTHVLDVTYSEWLNLLAATDISGKIELCEMPRRLPVSSRQRIKMVLVKSQCIDHASSVLINMDAIYKLQWNPNKSSCRWLLAGGQSGIVQLYDTSLVDSKAV